MFREAFIEAKTEVGATSEAWLHLQKTNKGFIDYEDISVISRRCKTNHAHSRERS